MAAIDVSVAAEYISGDKAPELLDGIDRIVATLWKLVHRRWAEMGPGHGCPAPLVSAPAVRESHEFYSV